MTPPVSPVANVMAVCLECQVSTKHCFSSLCALQALAVSSIPTVETNVEVVAVVAPGWATGKGTEGELVYIKINQISLLVSLRIKAELVGPQFH
jgi:hypothetical protein